MSEPAIQIPGLAKSFKHFTLGPLDLTVPKGAIYGLIGPNGVGKTTTIDLMLGMGRNDAGTIRVLGLDHIRDEVAMKGRIGYVSPDLNYQPWRTVSRVIRFHRWFYPDWDDEYCRNLLETLQVGWDEKIANLSFGTRIKLALIVALSHRPSVLLLDEPTVGLDVISKQQVFAELLAAVQDEERTVLIASHGLADIERFADHVGIIKDGKLLLEGATTDIVSRYRLVDFFAGDGFMPAGIAGLFVQERQGNRWRVLMDIEGSALEQVKARGASGIATSPVTLKICSSGCSRSVEMWRLLRDQVERDKWKVLGFVAGALLFPLLTSLWGVFDARARRGSQAYRVLRVLLLVVFRRICGRGLDDGGQTPASHSGASRAVPGGRAGLVAWCHHTCHCHWRVGVRLARDR